MKISIGSKYEGELDFFMVPMVCACCGERRHIRLAFGSDGTMWLDPAELGIGPQQATQLNGFGEAYLLTNEGTGEAMINARAVLLVKTDPEWGKRWLAFVEDMLKKHKEIRARYESSRNN